MFLFCTLVALGSARGRHLRHHRHHAYNMREDKYQTFVTLWQRVMGRNVDFRKPEIMSRLQADYDQLVRRNRLEDWTRRMICLAPGYTPAGIQNRPEVFQQVLKDSPRFIPEWGAQGVRPEDFPQGSVEDEPLAQCPQEGVDRLRRYGRHHRRIERIAIVLDSRGPKYQYDQAYFDMIGLFYMTAVRSPGISPHQAEALAYALQERALDLGLTGAERLGAFLPAGMELIKEFIPARFIQRDGLLQSDWISEIVGQAGMFGAKVYDVKYWVALWEFGPKLWLFAVANFGFAMRARLAQLKTKMYYLKHGNYACIYHKPRPYTAAELMAVFSKTRKWFNRNQHRWN